MLGRSAHEEHEEAFPGEAQLAAQPKRRDREVVEGEFWEMCALRHKGQAGSAGLTSQWQSRSRGRVLGIRGPRRDARDAGFK